MQSEQIDQLAAALAAAQGELLPAIKDAQNPHLRNRDGLPDGVEYRPVLGCTGYIVGDDGSIYSNRLMGPRVRLGGPWKLRKPHLNSRNKYPSLNMACDDGQWRTKTVHVLVLEAFVGPRPEGMEACHNNGNRQDCRLSNLRWDSPSGNHADRVAHGTSNRGERQWLSKLDDDKVRHIRRALSAGACKTDLAREYGVSFGAIYHVARRSTWAHIQD